MIDQYHPVESPRTTPRRPGRARTTRPVNPRTTAAFPVQLCTEAEINPVNDTSAVPRAAATQRRSSADMLTAICDPDQRATDRNLRLIAGAIPAGQPMPDPERPRTQMRNFLNAAGAILDEQPSERTARATGLRLQHALTGLINDAAKTKREAA